VLEGRGDMCESWRAERNMYKGWRAEDKVGEDRRMGRP